MRVGDERRCEMFQSVQLFGEKNAALFPAEGAAAVAFRELVSVNAHLKARDPFAAWPHHAVSRRRAQARAALLQALRDVRRCARAMDDEVPALASSFHFPRSQSDRQLTFAANAFIEAARPHQRVFIGCGLSDDFIEQLHSKVFSLEQAIGETSEKWMTRAENRVADAQALAAGMRLVHRLDVVVELATRADPVAAAEWKRARRIERP